MYIVVKKLRYHAVLAMQERESVDIKKEITHDIDIEVKKEVDIDIKKEITQDIDIDIKKDVQCKAWFLVNSYRLN